MAVLKDLNVVSFDNFIDSFTITLIKGCFGGLTHSVIA